jgi:hypothetical protein
MKRISLFLLLLAASVRIFQIKAKIFGWVMGTIQDMLQQVQVAALQIASNSNCILLLKM